METGIILLAAGNSSRLGRPKQLLEYEGKTLLERSVETALRSSCRPALVVLGAYAAQMPRIIHPELTYIVNDLWHDGMAGSIKTGLKALLEQQAALENVVIAVTDQVFLNAEIIDALIASKAATAKNIIASGYAQTMGTPVLFNKSYFGSLLELSGNEGAKILLERHPNEVQIVTFESGGIDIDTEADFNNLIQQR